MCFALTSGFVAVNCLFSRIYWTLDGIKDMICAGFTRSKAPLLGIILYRFCCILAEGLLVVFCLCCMYVRFFKPHRWPYSFLQRSLELSTGCFGDFFVSRV